MFNLGTCIDNKDRALPSRRLPWWLSSKESDALCETWVQPLGQEDPLEKDTAIHSSILAQRIPWTEEPGGLQSVGSQRVGDDWDTKHTHLQGAYMPMGGKNIKKTTHSKK